MQKKYWLGLFMLALLLLFFGNGSLLVTDSVESNYALTAKEMVLSGDWLSPQMYGNYWYDKPIMSYWLTALGFKLFGFTEFGARFFPALFGLLGIGLVSYGGYRLYNEKVGFSVIIVNEKSMKDFLKQNKHQWQLAGRSERYLLLSPQVEQGRMDDSLLACYNSDVRARLTVKNEWRNQHGRT